MSRIAKKKISIPENVKIILKNNNIQVLCNNKSISYIFHHSVTIKHDNHQLSFQSKSNQHHGWMQAGTARSLVNSMIIGVTVGFSKKLELIGVGYRFSIEKNNILNLSLGYSHTIKYHVPHDVVVQNISATEILLKSFNKQLLGQVAANIRKKRKPESYKGKGIRYFNEKIRIKEAKKK